MKARTRKIPFKKLPKEGSLTVLITRDSDITNYHHIGDNVTTEDLEEIATKLIIRIAKEEEVGITEVIARVFFNLVD